MGLLGLGAVAYLLLFLPPDAGISNWTSDKVGHVAVGFTLALSLHALFPGRRLMVVFVATVAMAALSEVLQQFVGRDAELLDLAADAGGALVYIALAALIVNLKR